MEENIKDVVKEAYYLYKSGLVSGSAGNLSMRLNHEKIAITPTRVPLSMVTEENVAIVDMDGRRLLGSEPSSELYLHLKIYKERDDINGIAHTHSPYATAFSFSNKKFNCLEGYSTTKNFMEEVEYHKPGSLELAEECAKKIKCADVLILKNHGIVSCASNLRKAVQLAEFVEETAKIQFIAYILNKV